jgi:antitoxin PrlF
MVNRECKEILESNPMEEQKEYIGTITSKGQVTIPAAVREALGLSAQDKVVFRLSAGNKVVLEPLPMSLEEAFGSVQPLSRPENFAALRETAREERIERSAHRQANE